jgi:hypothetical protein
LLPKGRLAVLKFEELIWKWGYLKKKNKKMSKFGEEESV